MIQIYSIVFTIILTWVLYTNVIIPYADRVGDDIIHKTIMKHN